MLYTTIKKPDDMTDEEWALWTSSDVRRLIAYNPGVDFSTFKDMV